MEAAAGAKIVSEDAIETSEQKMKGEAEASAPVDVDIRSKKAETSGLRQMRITRGNTISRHLDGGQVEGGRQ